METFSRTENKSSAKEIVLQTAVVQRLTVCRLVTVPSIGCVSVPKHDIIILSPVANKPVQHGIHLNTCNSLNCLHTNVYILS